jgi:hypothetical protein
VDAFRALNASTYASKAALEDSPDWFELTTKVPAETTVEVNKTIKVISFFIFPPCEIK